MNVIHCEKIGFEDRFSKQQMIDEDITIRSIRLVSTVRVYINLNR